MTEDYDEAIRLIESEFPPGEMAIMVTPQGDRHIKIEGVVFAFNQGFQGGTFRLCVSGAYEQEKHRSTKKVRRHQQTLSILAARDCLTLATPWEEKIKAN